MTEQTKKAFETETINGRGMGIFATTILEGQSVGIDFVALDYNLKEDDFNFIVEDVEREEGFLGWVFDEDFFEKVEAISLLVPEMKKDFVEMRRIVTEKLEVE